MTESSPHPGASRPADSDAPVTLFAFVRRRTDLSREEFLVHWRDRHGPLIRDTPGLGDRIERYEQHAVREDDRSGFDGVAVQTYRDWQTFLDILSSPAGEAMRADEAQFLDPSSIQVVFTGDRVVVIDGEEAS